uniref:Uncharacterized protein n=1 Tax=Strigamia maritima TaxID=126957 RepID=T1JIT4_STRMM
MHQYIGRVDQAAREVEALTMTDEEAKTFMLISRVGPGFDSLKQIIDQWDDTQFTCKNVCAALLTEDHRRKFDAAATLTEHTEAQAFLAFKKSQKSKEKKTAINIPSSKCQEKGHYSNKCQNAAVPRGNKTRGGAVRGRGCDKAEAYYCKRVRDIQNVVACMTVINNLTWYLDCTCSDHVCSDKSVFSNFRVVKDAPLELSEGYSTVQGMRDIKLG